MKRFSKLSGASVYPVVLATSVSIAAGFTRAHSEVLSHHQLAKIDTAR